MANKLRKLAKTIYQLTREDIWLGGKGPHSPWPKRIKGFIWDPNERGWGESVTWTLSPEVVLGEHRVRVCVSWTGSSTEYHHVRVFIDDELKHPGGMYQGWNGNWFGGWSWRIASMERRDGGKTGPIGREDALLNAAERYLKGDRPDKVQAPLYCDACYDALVQVTTSHPRVHTGCPTCACRPDEEAP